MHPNGHEELELHDTRVLGILRESGGVRLQLSAYLHRSKGRPGIDAGTGWSQDALLTVEAGTIGDAPEGGVLWVTEGSIQVGATLFDNMVPLPFERIEGPVTIRFQGGEGLLVIKGSAVSITLPGEPEFIEEVPG
jgi:hypothetical protein